MSRLRQIILGLALGVWATGPVAAQDDAGIVVYTSQHAALTQAWADGFTAETGIPVTIRKGTDTVVANQIIQEGAKSPADVFLTENSPSLTSDLLDLLAFADDVMPFDDHARARLETLDHHLVADRRPERHVAAHGAAVDDGPHRLAVAELDEARERHHERRGELPSRNLEARQHAGPQPPVRVRQLGLDREGARVGIELGAEAFDPRREALAGRAGAQELAARRPVQRRVSDETRITGVAGRGRDHDPSATHRLAHSVVRLTHELELDTRCEERSEALAGSALEARSDASGGRS